MGRALSEQVTLTLPPDFRGKLNREGEDGFAAKKQKAQKGEFNREWILRRRAFHLREAYGGRDWRRRELTLRRKAYGGQARMGRKKWK